MTDWQHFHSCAEEVALWTTIAINCWIIIGGIIFALTFLWRASLSYSKRILLAARESAVFIGYSAAIILVYYVENFVFNDHKSLPYGAVAAALGVMTVAYIIRVILIFRKKISN
jgi:hypothetical protein